MSALLLLAAVAPPGFAYVDEPPPGWRHPEHPPPAGGVGESRVSASFSVRAFGAAGDGACNDTAAFRAAIAACERANPSPSSTRCEVIVPDGRYVIGGIHLVSNLNLVLLGTLTGPMEPAGWLSPESGWRSMNLLNASDVSNVSVLGPRTSPPGVDFLADGSVSVHGEPDGLGGTLDLLGPELWYANCTRTGPFCYGGGRH